LAITELRRLGKAMVAGFCSEMNIRHHLETQKYDAESEIRKVDAALLFWKKIPDLGRDCLSIR